MNADAPLDPATRPAINPWIIAMTAASATFIEVLATSIANVALPHIAGSLSISVHESTWVLASYLVANAVVLPLTGWLSFRIRESRTQGEIPESVRGWKLLKLYE